MMNLFQAAAAAALFATPVPTHAPLHQLRGPRADQIEYQGDPADSLFKAARKARDASDLRRAANIYQSIGVYLGYSIAHYAEFYDFAHLLVLGRVTSGAGGEIIVDTARKILAKQFPELRIQLHLPDEKEKRHGQAIAAASLPVLAK